ncbi:hypothetical protein LTR84_011671 [Exophiala bonariae]|uniref:Major facilitator superfamily (MFS) profile domain-containing protein n=1 Tax=Exophiala bonariae TaxID=1690606 RepID=A0AAV9NGN2_9EURO|nr:hypothetical protein LTR84_011671 [Exophiala bonariae]
MSSANEVNYVSRLVPRSEKVLNGLIIATCFIDSVMTGFDSSIMGGLNVMDSYQSYFTLSTATYSLNTAISYVGGCIGALFAGHLVDIRGRREGLLIAAAICCVGAVIQAAAIHIAMFIVGRFIIGIGMAIAATACPIYVAECSKPSLRAFAMGLYYGCWGVGTLLANASESWSSSWAWRLPSLIQTVPSLAAMIVIVFIPESPRWLISRDRHAEALQVIAMVNSNGNREDPTTVIQYREISDTLAWEKSEGRQMTLAQAWSTSVNRKRISIAASYSVIVMLCGNNTITYYFGVMMSQAGVTNVRTQLIINIILTIWALAICVVTSWYCDFFPRKVLCCLGLGGVAVFIYMLGALTSVYGESDNKSGIYATLAMIFLVRGAYSFGIQPLTVLYPTEILSYQIRATGMGFYTFTTKACGLISTMGAPFALRNIGWKTYMIFGSADVIMVILVWVFWVETRGLTLEEVDERFYGVKHSDVPDLKDVKKEGANPKLIDSVSVDEEGGIPCNEPAEKIQAMPAR